MCPCTEKACLYRLDHHANDLGDEGSSPLAPTLLQLTALRYLGLHDNRLGCVGTSALAPALKSSLLFILLISMTITQGMLELLFRAHEDCSSSCSSSELTELKHLDLHTNSLGNLGAHLTQYPYQISL